jgi:hypothetical protein
VRGASVNFSTGFLLRFFSRERPPAMGPLEWITAVTALGGFVAWMTAMWVRAGRILQRIDDISGDHLKLREQVDAHGTRLTRLEVVAERNR